MNYATFKQDLLCFLLMLSGLVGLAQPSNDECQFAKFLPDVSDYCSEPKEFTNTAATPDPSFPNGCVALKFANGVWFSFLQANRLFQSAF